jgi:hypothetical protein
VALNPSLGGIGGRPKKVTLSERRCGRVGNVPVYASGVSCATAKGVYRSYIRAGRARGWHCSPAGELCYQHKRRKTTYVSWWSRQLARPTPMR